MKDRTDFGFQRVTAPQLKNMGKRGVSRRCFLIIGHRMIHVGEFVLQPAALLLQAALAPGESGYFSLPTPLGSLLPSTLEIQQRSTLQIFMLEARSFQPVVNIFVTRSKSPDG